MSGCDFRGGPLEDGPTTIHALHVYLIGDGMHSIGWYEQVYDGDVPTGVFDWKEPPGWPDEEADR